MAELTKEQQEAFDARNSATQTILDDDSDKKVIVAGPGTGKTTLFKKIFASKEGTGNLTLTFINALVEDLSLELHGISEVRTLHSFALSRFSEGKIRLFPRLPVVIKRDAKAVLGVDVDLEEKIYEMDESDGVLDFYSARRKYYDYFSHSDIILGLVKFFEQNPDRIPTYSQVVVDEFQDFNKLEVTLIEQLARNSPIVIAGDDDQAIYKFKKANPDFIRTLHGATRPEFKSFPLPYCSRSTRVIVDAINDFVESAVTKGHLTGRVPKSYVYFPSPLKDAESAEYPEIINSRLEESQIAWFIEREINKLAGTKREKFEVLVISPFTGQCERIGRTLESKGFVSVDAKERSSEKDLSYFDGLALLSEARTDTKASNLGWRIAGGAKITEDELNAAINKSHADPNLKFRDLLPVELQKQINADVAILKKIRSKDAVDEKELDQVINNSDFKNQKIKEDFLRGMLGTGKASVKCNPGIKRIPITVTTVQSSKGLAADYVFITHFDDRYFLNEGTTVDTQNICNFLVALTRARKKVWLLSTTDAGCQFKQWVKPERIKSE